MKWGRCLKGLASGCRECGKERNQDSNPWSLGLCKWLRAFETGERQEGGGKEEVGKETAGPCNVLTGTPAPQQPRLMELFPGAF